MTKKLLGALCATVTAACVLATPTVLVQAGADAAVDAAAPVVIRPAQLERGDDIRIPHLEGRVVVDGEVRIPVSGRTVALLGRAGDGYVVVVRRSGRWTTLKVAEGRDPLVLARRKQPGELVLADDGRRLAVTRSASAGATVIEVVRTTDGQSVARREFGGYTDVLDVDGPRAILSGNGFGALSWNLRTDRTRSVTARTTYAADIGSNRLALLTGDPYDGGCSVLTRLEAPARRLWTSCSERVVAISPDGSRVATVGLLSDGLGPDRFRERGARGVLLGDYRVAFFFGAMTWESNTDLVVTAYGRRQYAEVRTSEGAVERVSALRPNPDF